MYGQIAFGFLTKEAGLDARVLLLYGQIAFGFLTKEAGLDARVLLLYGQIAEHFDKTNCARCAICFYYGQIFVWSKYMNACRFSETGRAFLKGRRAFIYHMIIGV